MSADARSAGSATASRGAYVVDITPKDAQGRLIGKRRQRWAQGFPGMGAAQAALNQLQVEKEAGTYIDPSRITLGNSIGVQQQLGLDANDDGERDLAPVKTRNGRRATSVIDDTIRVLRDHHAAQEFERRSWGDIYRLDLDLVLSRPDGTPEDPDGVTHRFERAWNEPARR